MDGITRISAIQSSSSTSKFVGLKMPQHSLVLFNTSISCFTCLILNVIESVQSESRLNGSNTIDYPNH